MARFRRSRSALGALVTVLAFVPLGTASGLAQSAGPTMTGCAEFLPRAVWDVSIDGPVVVQSTKLERTVTARFAEVADTVAGWLTADLGTSGTALVCIVADDQDVSDLQLPPGQQLNAIVLTDRNTLIVSNRLLRLVEPTIGFGLAYGALWEYATAAGLAGYPEPLATTVARWYSTRVTQRQALHHAAMRGANLFETEARIDWTEAAQSEVLVFNPEFNESALDDVVEYAVDERGPGVLRDPTAGTWADVETEWRRALRFELTGREGPTTGWILGLAMVVGLLTAAAGTALLGRRSRRAATRR